MCQPTIEGFHDQTTGTVSYVVFDPGSSDAVIIDPVLDYDPVSGRTSMHSMERLLDFVAERALNVRYVLETHVHADHLTAAARLREKIGVPVATGSGVVGVQHCFAEVYDMPFDLLAANAFDLLLDDDEVLRAGTLRIHTMHTPGHTPGCASYVIGEACFVGDTLFMPDFGTARCDFPGGDSGVLFDSIQRILALPAWTTLYVGHDYAPNGREPCWKTTVAEEVRRNRHLNNTDREGFKALRDERDAGLDLPRLILPAVQVNVCAGRPPQRDSSGRGYLRIPMNAI